MNIEKSEFGQTTDGTPVQLYTLTNDNELNKQIYKDCQQLEILCNVVDVPPLCDFYVPAVVKRKELQIAIATDGKCPAYSGHLRRKLEQMFTEKHGDFLNELDSARKAVIENIEDPNQRKSLLGQLVKDESFDYFVENGSEMWQQYAQKIISG